MSQHHRHRHQQEPKSLLDSLYCSEQNFEEHLEEDESEQKEFDHYSNYLSANVSTRTRGGDSTVFFLEQDLLWDDEELTSLLAKEQHNQLCACIESNPFLACARREAVEWILKVNARYSFSALTAVLAVNYLDRSLFSFQFHNGKPWMTQLAAVACLSLAAKVEETQMPLSVDLQVEDSRYVFEAKTIKRMEILVLSTLGWKMNPATPLSFIDFITRRLGLKGYLCSEFLRRCEGLFLSVFTDCRLMSYPPSVLATATVIHVVNSLETRLGIEFQNQLLGILGINKDKVDECYKMMLEVASGYDEGKQCNKRKFGCIPTTVPSSPNGVMDDQVSFSSDSSNGSWALAASVPSSPEPLSKKTRTQESMPDFTEASRPRFTHHSSLANLGP